MQARRLRKNPWMHPHHAELCYKNFLMSRYAIQHPSDGSYAIQTSSSCRVMQFNILLMDIMQFKRPPHAELCNSNIILIPSYAIQTSSSYRVMQLKHHHHAELCNKNILLMQSYAIRTSSSCRVMQFKRPPHAEICNSNILLMQSYAIQTSSSCRIMQFKRPPHAELCNSNILLMQSYAIQTSSSCRVMQFKHSTPTWNVKRKTRRDIYTDAFQIMRNNFCYLMACWIQQMKLIPVINKSTEIWFKKKKLMLTNRCANASDCSLAEL